MIAPANPNDETGGLGGNFRPQSTRDTRMMERAIRQRWPIPEAYKQPVVDRMYKIASDEKSKTREATIAARVLVAMEQQNQADELKHLPDLHEHSGTIDHQMSIRELLDETEYAEFLRDREVHSDPRLIGQNGHAGNGQPLDDGPSRNGH